MPKNTKIFLQTQVDARVARVFRSLARADGHTRASYLRRLVEMHVSAMRSPRLVRAMRKTKDNQL